jgi:phage gp45-like
MFFEHEDGLRSSIRRARIVKVDDSQSQQRVDISGLMNEKPKKIFRPMDHGFTSNPPVDTEGVMIQMGSRSDRTLYCDGGHKDYRPKNTPVGGTLLYNHTGDVVRVVKDTLDITHSKNLKLSIGKGVKNSDDTVTMVMKAGSITLTIGGSSVKIESSQITYTSAKHVLVGEVHLGADGGEPIGLCGGGCSTKVFAT